MHRRALGGVATLVLLITFAPGVSGQTYQGGVRGVVRDGSGGVLPGVSVTLVNEGTNVTRAAVTRQTGEFVFANLVPGTYSLTATLAGFQSFRQTGIEIGVQRFVVADAVLRLGFVEETVLVTGESLILETATASVSASLEQAEMRILPTASRNPFFLAITTPNVVPTGNPQFTRMQDQNATSALSISGGPQRGNNYTLDGVPITDMGNRAVIIPSMESVEEVKVQASTYDAEMGRTGGGVFNTVHRSGNNQWHGSALVQNRPQWGTGQLYFAKEAGEPKLDTYYWLWGGSFGGAIIPDKTFFWAATEGYRTNVTRNTVRNFPSMEQTLGDFSQSGRVIYDPLTTRPDPSNPDQFIRDPFPGNVIPADRLNPVGLNIAAFLAGNPPGESSRTANVVDAANQFSLNLTHSFSQNLSVSGTYMFYDSSEPAPLFIDNPYDPAQGDLFRQVHLLALNGTYLPNDSSVLTMRYGYFQFEDDFRAPPFDPAQLGFSQNYLNQIPVETFPGVGLDFYPSGGSGASDDFTGTSHNVNGVWSKFVGRHTIKAGADYRRINQGVFVPGDASGDFTFDTEFTQGPDPNNPAPDTGDDLASLLLGFPSEGFLPVRTQRDLYINYLGAFVQDDWRVNDALVLNLGLRIEHEQGVQEVEDRLTVGFDRETPWPIQRVEGMTLRGGLMYAGVYGNPRHQGDPSTVKFGPRAGFAWSLDERTVLRGGYGLFWVPFQPTFEDARGYDAETTYLASTDGGLTPAGTLTDPFPDGVEQPRGNRLGLLTGAGSNVEFADQFRKSAYVQQFSFDFQRDIGESFVLSAGYLGSRSDRLGLSGATGATVNINQLDPKYQSLGTALQEQVPNPFYGNPIFGNLSNTETIDRAQLLLPYPQFEELAAYQVGEGIRRYHSMVLRAQKRFRDGWGARVNYTFSRNDDNIFGEGNFFSGRPGNPLNNYDLVEGEYARSISDIPHRLNVSGVFQLPFGRGQRWLDDGGFWSGLASGWTVSLTGFYQSGFPVAIEQNVNNSGLIGSGQRPNVVPDVEPGHSGSTVDNLDNYLNPEAWSQAEAFTFGDAPRTDTRVRAPTQKNLDLAFQNTQNIGGARVTFRMEMINVFDTPAFRGPRNSWGSRNFGRIDRVSGFPRTFQFTLRFDW